MRSDLSHVATWDRARCAAEWQKVTGRGAGRHLSANYLRKALAFEAQCKELGGHSAAVKQRLRKLVVPLAKNGTAKTGKPLLVPSTQLVREWNGRIYRVLVTDDAIATAQRALWDTARIAAEPAGAAGLAALMSGAFVPEPDARVGVIVCGGNLGKPPFG